MSDNVQAVQSHADDRWERAITALKIDLASLREALLGRAEDRARFTMRMETTQSALDEIRDRLETLEQRSDAVSELAEAAHKAVGGLQSLEDTLAMVEINGTRYQQAVLESLARAEIDREALNDRVNRMQLEMDQLEKIARQAGARGKLIRWLAGSGAIPFAEDKR